MKHIIITLAILSAGCVTSNEEPELEPLPPEKLFDNLLYEGSLKDIAYKSVTKKDYECKEDC